MATLGGFLWSFWQHLGRARHQLWTAHDHHFVAGVYSQQHHGGRVDVVCGHFADPWPHPFWIWRNAALGRHPRMALFNIIAAWLSPSPKRTSRKLDTFQVMLVLFTVSTGVQKLEKSGSGLNQRSSIWKTFVGFWLDFVLFITSNHIIANLLHCAACLLLAFYFIAKNSPLENVEMKVYGLSSMGNECAVAVQIYRCRRYMNSSIQGSILNSNIMADDKKFHPVGARGSCHVPFQSSTCYD